MESSDTPLEPTEAGEPTEAFGAILLRSMKEEGLPLSTFSYKVLQELKVADREETTRILRRAAGGMSYAMIQQFKKQPPERIAQRMAMQYQLAAQSSATAFVLPMLFLS